MARYSRREVALIAHLLADRLISTYRNEQVPLMVENFERAGFTRDQLLEQRDKLFQMLVTAAYDRRPFSGAAGGYEVIWGIRTRTGSIPATLEKLGLSTVEAVLARGTEGVGERLEGETYHGRSLTTDDAKVEYARTLVDCATLVDRGLATGFAHAATTEDASSIYEKLTTVHGIGDTIGAKLVKYLLREIAVGKVQPGSFPLSVVWPITGEFHAAEAAGKLAARVDAMLTPLAMGLLLKAGEPFAIDGLFYLQRYRERDFDAFIEDLQSICIPTQRVEPSTRPPEPRKVDQELARALLGVIEEILEVARSVTEHDVKRAGLQGIVSAKEIQGSARWLYNQMGKLAQEGQAAEMKAFYENCLESPRGKHIGWALDQLGRKSMESEAARFRAMYEANAGTRRPEPDVRASNRGV